MTLYALYRGRGEMVFCFFMKWNIVEVDTKGFTNVCAKHFPMW